MAINYMNLHLTTEFPALHLSLIYSVYVSGDTAELHVTCVGCGTEVDYSGATVPLKDVLELSAAVIRHHRLMMDTDTPITFKWKESTCG